MNISFKHYMESNVMIIKDENILANDYMIDMIMKNNINNLLKLSISCMDGNVELVYDISGKQSIEGYCLKEKLVYNEVKLIFKSLVMLSKDVSRYLLDMNHILLDVDYIFINNNADNIYFSYYVNNNMEFYESLKKMVQRLVMITSHSDRQAVEFIYGILNICEKDNFLLSEIEEYMDNFAELKINLSVDENIKKKNNVESNIEENVRMEIQDNNYGNEENVFEKKKVKKEGVIGVISNILNSKTKENIKPYYDNDYVNVTYVAENQSESMENMRHNKVNKDEKSNDIMNEDTIYIGNAVKLNNRKLCSISGEGDIVISDYPFVIGKNPGKADGIIKDNSISRMHAKIEMINESCYVIEDLNSKNGTYVNDERLNPYEKVVINIGDKLKFSAFEYFFM